MNFLSAARLLQRLKKNYRLTAYAKVCLMLILSWFIIDNACAGTENESAVKTGFLYNFFKFIEWPQTAGTSGGYSLCTASDDNGLNNSLQALQGKTINNQPLSIKLGISGKELKSCHMVFIGENEDLRRSINNLQGLAAVTVSDKPDFINQGGMIGLIQKNNHLAFEVNLDAANAVDIHISAPMLKLAKRVNAAK